MRKVLFVFTALVLMPVLVPPVTAASTTASTLSEHGSAVLLEGSVLLVAGAGELVAASVRTAGESTTVVLDGLLQGARVSATVLLQGAGALTLAAGDVLRLAGTASGHLLVRGSEVLAFVPDQVGNALFHHERLTP